MPRMRDFLTPSPFSPALPVRLRFGEGVVLSSTSLDAVRGRQDRQNPLGTGRSGTAEETARTALDLVDRFPLAFALARPLHALCPRLLMILVRDLRGRRGLLDHELTLLGRHRESAV